MLKQALIALCVFVNFSAADTDEMGVTAESLSDKVGLRYSIVGNTDGEFVVFFRDEAGTKEVPCRPVAADLQSILSEPELSALSYLYGENPSSESSGNTVSVSGNWLRLGLEIENQAKGWLLVIEHLTLSAIGEHEEQVFHNFGSLSKGYCGLPFLYAVPGGIFLRHKPLSENPLENLTLFVSDFPGIDIDDNRVIVPRYKMQLSLYGWFISVGEDGKVSLVPFLKRFPFTPLSAADVSAG